MLNVVTLLWEPNEHSQWFSKCYDERWVHRLYDGFRRHLTKPFRFVLYTDRPRKVDHTICQMMMSAAKPQYGNCIEPYGLGEPMILCGLDTVVVGDCDALADYCLTAAQIALPRDPYHRERACNGVALVPAGQKHIYETWNGENDMGWVRKQPHAFIDDVFPGQVQSYKGSIKKHGLGNTRIVYFHGAEKPHELTDLPWIRQYWLGNAP